MLKHLFGVFVIASVPSLISAQAVSTEELSDYLSDRATIRLYSDEKVHSVARDKKLPEADFLKQEGELLKENVKGIQRIVMVLNSAPTDCCIPAVSMFNAQKKLDAFDLLRNERTLLYNLYMEYPIEGREEMYRFVSEVEAEAAVAFGLMVLGLGWEARVENNQLDSKWHLPLSERPPGITQDEAWAAPVTVIYERVNHTQNWGVRTISGWEGDRKLDAEKQFLQHIGVQDKGR